MPHEPFLILLARDLAAPDTIRFWADRRAQMGVEEEIDQDAEQLSEALETADTMEAWRIEHDGEWRNHPASLPELAKTPSEEATSLAGSILARRKMLDDQSVIMALIEGIAEANSGQEAQQVIKRLFGPFFDDAKSMAGALLRLDTTPGQDGNGG